MQNPLIKYAWHLQAKLVGAKKCHCEHLSGFSGGMQKKTPNNVIAKEPKATAAISTVILKKTSIFLGGAKRRGNLNPRNTLHEIRNTLQATAIINIDDPP